MFNRAVIIVICGTLILLLAFGIRTSFGLFLSPMSADLGWGREVFAFAMALQNLVWGLAQPFAGALADRYGSGKVVAVSGTLYAAGLYLMSQSTSPETFTLSAGIMIGVALSGTGFPVILAVIGRNVPASKRAFYLGLGGAGGSSGQLLVVPGSHALLESVGWSQSLLVLGVIAFVMVPLAAAMAGKPASSEGEYKQSLVEAIREASRHGGYWYLTAGFFVCGFHVAFISTHLPAFITDSGQAEWLGAASLTIIGLANILGSLTAGILGSRIRQKYLLSAIYLGRAFVITAFILFPVSQLSIILFSAGMGFLWLSTVPLTSGLVAHIFGLRYMATLFGFVFFSHQMGAFLGAWMGGYFFDLTGSYDAVWWTAVALGLAAAVLHLPIDDASIERVSMDVSGAVLGPTRDPTSDSPTTLGPGLAMAVGGSLLLLAAALEFL